MHTYIHESWWISLISLHNYHQSPSFRGFVSIELPCIIYLYIYLSIYLSIYSTQTPPSSSFPSSKQRITTVQWVSIILNQHIRFQRRSIDMMMTCMKMNQLWLRWIVTSHECLPVNDDNDDDGYVVVEVVVAVIRARVLLFAMILQKFRTWSCCVKVQ